MGINRNRDHSQKQHHPKKVPALTLSHDFQNRILGKILRRCDARRQRLTRLSYATDLPTSEIVRIESVCEQIDMNMATLLDKYGYINKEQAKTDLYQAALSTKYEAKLRENAILMKLTQDQKKQVDIYTTAYIKERRKRDEDAYNVYCKMVTDFVKENEKAQSWKDFQNQKSNSQSNVTTN